MQDKCETAGHAAVTLAYTTRVFIFGSEKTTEPCHIKQM